MKRMNKTEMILDMIINAIIIISITVWIGIIVYLSIK